MKNQNGTGNKAFIKAKNGLLTSTNTNTLSLDLFDGYYYEDVLNIRKPNNPNQPFVKSSFEKNRINIDISKLNESNANDENVSSNTMLNITELNYTIDSLNVKFTKEINSYSETATIPLQVKLISYAKDSTKIKSFQNIDEVLNHFTPDDQNRVMNLAVSVFENNISNISLKKLYLDEQQKNINSHWIILNEKFVIAASCILMFFIGAPLGAIIRKGGIGLPIVFAILIFITYHFINTFGKKVAQEDGMNPMLGAWLATLVLVPLAIFLTYRATNDMNVTINLDWLIDPIKKLFSKKKKQTT
ncbi:LptF/LptG family permease [Flavobacterium agricola]|uniref:LptF/LptG family permease n=1 Tax=Flavobacterium agricola TaxID=2870839 RepID=UPI0029390FCB|nr:LptF/LptG family permease [Flavobacterium agricola]